MAGRQIQFQEKQTHNKQFELAVLGFSVLCIVFAVVAIQFF